MKQLRLVLAGITALSACSGEREQRVPANDRVAQQADLTLPDTLSRKDTSVTLSARTAEPASPAAKPAPTVSQRPRPAKTRSRTVGHRSHPAVATPRPEAEDTTVRAYAPGGVREAPIAADSSAKRDSATVATAAPAPQRSDSGSSSTPDTVASALETNAESTSTSRPDTSRAASADTTAPARDSAPTRSVDTARTNDTTARATPDTTSSVAQPVIPSASAGETRSAASRTLPIGTEIHAALDDSITSRRDTVGAQVDGHVMENVKGPDGRTLIAAGTPVRFTVTQIRPSRSKSSQGRLALRAEGISFSDRLQSVKAEVKPVPRELRGRGVTGSEAAKVGGGAAAGAVIGGVVGNTKGAVIGGVAGAAAGAVVASQTATRDVVVKAKTPVVLVLTAPLVAP
ncbi:MAG: hypothetical protein ACJ8AY_03960 [Gemmatimonadales bacterium]